MFCKECGKELDAVAKFCPDCGAKVIVNENCDEIDIENIPYESVQQKAVSDAEKLFSALSKCFAGYGIIHAFVSLFLNHGLSHSSFRIVLLMFVIAAGSFAICYSIRKKSPVTEHFKFKCPRCNEENIVSADIDTAFECKKCQKKFIVVENNIKIID